MSRTHPRLRVGLGLAVALACSGPEGMPAPPVSPEAQVRLAAGAGELRGTFDLPNGEGPFPVVLIIAGSGPTDRDGNQPALKNDSLKQLGRGLAARGIAALRYDRRGIAASASAGRREEDLRFEMLVDDAARLIDLLEADRRFSGVGAAGHSEGALVALLAAKRAGARAFVSLAGLGRPASEALREQLAAKPLFRLSGLKARADRIIDELAEGRTVADPPRELDMLFRPGVQAYLISYFRHDPALEIATLRAPALVVQGTTDLQTSVEDARRLVAAREGARLLLVEGMNHVLKRATTPAEQRAAYTDPSVPLAPGLVDPIAEFLREALSSDRDRRPGDSPRPRPEVRPRAGSASSPPRR